MRDTSVHDVCEESPNPFHWRTRGFEVLNLWLTDKIANQECRQIFRRKPALSGLSSISFVVAPVLWDYCVLMSITNQTTTVILAFA